MERKRALLIALLLALLAPVAQAQYFGQNKPNYESFDYQVIQTPNFEIYHYLENEEALHWLANQSEHWYHMHQHVLKDTIQRKNPLLFYNNHADFQQTNAISGDIGVGTGGVTEAFKNRIVMPIAMSNEQTNHVLGHEMVHAFQYNMILNGDSTDLRSLGNLPLWMVEGLAEYMSIGSVDAHTAMWMRDAVLNDDVPSLDDLNNLGKYFPYRWGHVFWAFVTGLRGDDLIEPLFTSTAKYGLEQAILMEMGMSKANLSELWEATIRKYYGEFVAGKEENPVGRKLVNRDNGGRLNIAPVISPNGRYVIYLSEKDLFSIDLFLADANTGETIRKVASSTRDGHIDDFNYIESAGAWSPQSDEFAFVGVSKGQNIIIIKDVETGKSEREVQLEGVPAFSNPAWSPDGQNIVVSGLVDGQVDLYSYDLRTGEVRQLTFDRYAELHPHWSANGDRILFATDELSIEQGRRNGHWNFNLAELDPVSGAKEHIDIFTGADNLNPIYDTDGNILFLSNRDGFRNLYKYDVFTGRVYRQTDFLTGISGITHYAPAISIARKRDRIAYMHYYNGAYSIYKARPEDFLSEEVDPQAVDFGPAQLPRVNKKAPAIVDAQLSEVEEMEPLRPGEIAEKKYKSKFRLDFIGGSAGVGVGTSNIIGTNTGAAGGIQMLFSDIVGNNQLFVNLAINGEIQDFGGAITYINRKGRIGWGGTLSHIPSFGLLDYQVANDTLRFEDGFLPVIRETFLTQRIFENRLGAFAFYPFSKSLRFEVGGAFTLYNYSWRRTDNYYDAFFNLIDREREGVDEYRGLERPSGFNLYNVEGALVGDNSFFGLTAPLAGYRFRFGANQFFGAFNFLNLTADYRRYFRLKPVTVAVRALHNGRYGGNADDLFPLFVVNPWYMRGYADFFGLTNFSELLSENGITTDQVAGSKILVGNFEVRLPFTGPEQLSAIKSRVLFSDLNLFVDGGVSWTDFDQFGGTEYTLDENGDRIPIRDPQTGEIIINPRTGEPDFVVSRFGVKPFFSTGLSLRVNLFGAIIVEPYYAIPFFSGADGNLEFQPGTFGINLMPGW